VFELLHSENKKGANRVLQKLLVFVFVVVHQGAAVLPNFGNLKS